MLTKDFLNQNIDKSRQQMRAMEFIRLSKCSLQLSGKNTEMFLSALRGTGKSRGAFEAVVIEDGDSIKRREGDAVTPDSVFCSSENVLWENDSIQYVTADKIKVSGSQYDYITKYGLGGNKFFARSNDRDSDVSATWKNIVRRTQEARKDKAKEILYITVGTVEWKPSDAKKDDRRAVSPLLFCPVKEEGSVKDKPRFRVTGDCFRVNTILGREIKRQFGIDIFSDGEKDIPFASVISYLEKVKENVSGAPAEIWFRGDDINLCMLDSSNETICQAVEKNFDALCASEIVRVLAGECEYKVKPLTEGCGLYPLLADDSQREVIKQAMSGNSVNVAAAAGTGKSQTMVNIAAGMVTVGKTVCVMSEKAAANEVFIKYAKSIGLNKYCLVLNNEMQVSEIVRQVKDITNMPRLYADAARGREILEAKKEVEEEFDVYNKAVYGNIPEINIQLYSLIGEAISCKASEKTDSLKVKNTSYISAKHKLRTLQNSLFKTMTDTEFSDFVQTEHTGDTELDEMLKAEIKKLVPDGVDILKYIRDNGIHRSEVADRAISDIARIIASDIISKGGITAYGNRRLKSMYGKLTDTYSRMSSLYMAFMIQQVSERVSRAVKNNKFVELLDRLKTSKITLADLFKTYGKDILSLCPIIVTTPSAAVSYITSDMNTFDALMIDEASQVPITSVLPFLVNDRQLITFGDNMQLDITSYFSRTDDGYANEDGDFELSLTDKSILHAVQGKNIPNCRLKYHYRSKTEHLLKVSNATCYDNTLNIVPDVYTGRENLPAWLGYEVVRIDDPEITDKGLNLSEARAIADRVMEIKNGDSEKSVGIITFNEGQHGLIIDELEARRDAGELDCNLDNDNDVWVRSLENAQGKEADVILICIGHYLRNKKDGSIHKAIADLNKAGGENRLNVLFTRAREKNIVFISFDYKELRDSENPRIQRLYKYLDYAVTGVFPDISEYGSGVCDTLNDNAIRMLESDDGGDMIFRKIGQNDLTVDIAVAHKDGKKYDMGILLPNTALTPNTVCTKVNVLERALWNVVPASPVYLLSQSDKFCEQMKSAVSAPTELGSAECENYITDVPQAAPILAYEIMNVTDITDAAPEGGGKEEENMLSITTEELLSTDFLALYADYLGKELIDADNHTLAVMSKAGSYKARICYVMKKLPELIGNGKLREVISIVSGTYVNKGENRLCYFFVQLLRALGDTETNGPIIEALLAESKLLGFIK